MKKCSKCNTTKNVDEFAKNSRKPDGLQVWCRPCKKINDSEYRKNNIQYFRDRAKSQREFWQNYIRNLKSSTPCTDCKILYPYYVMDFDHIFGEKEYSMGQIFLTNSKDKILKEIEKCEIVCSNCHRKRTWNRLQTAS